MAADRSRGGMNGPSPHLSWKELACKDGTPYPEEWRDSRGVTLAIEFEKIRAIVGHPIEVSSAYRTSEWNRRIGGARRSQHIEGRALDLYPPSSWSLENFYRIVRAVALRRGSWIYGLGKYPTHVHIDVRPAPKSKRLTAWHGSRIWTEGKA